MSALNHKLLEVAALNDDDQAVDQMLELVKTVPPLGDAGEEGDEVPEITNFTHRSDLEYDIKENEFITNPAGTWDFAKPVTMIFPHSLRGLVNAIGYAEARNLRVKGLGARHSFSRVPATDHLYIDLSRTFSYSSESHNEAVRKLDQSALALLKEGTDVKNHFDVPAGMNIWMINHILCPSEEDVNAGKEARFGQKRLFNMGGGDVQTFAGAFSTGTHGSGGTYSAYHDMVRSILLVASEGKVYRVEPSDGITDPNKHRDYYHAHPEEVPVTLLQDDDKFYSLLVSMGCFGVMYSAIIEITDMTLLHMEAFYHKGGWTREFVQKFKQPVLPADPQQELFYYVYVNPYKVKGRANPSILVREATPTDQPGSGKKETRRKLWPSVFSNWPLTVGLIRSIANSGVMPKKRIIESALKSLNDNRRKGRGYTDLAYRIWNSGSGKLKSIGTGIEVAFPVQEIPQVMETLLAALDSMGELNRGFYLNAPIALRFVRPSKAYLAPNYHQYKGREVNEWCYIEILRINSNNAADDERELKMYQHLQQMLSLQGGRVHWGLNFGFDFDKPLLMQLYPKFDIWLESYRFFNGKGTFENEFARKAGLNEPAETPVV